MTTAQLRSQPDEVTLQEVKQVAADIAAWCLRRWDGILGMMAGTDSGGAKAGIWRQDYDGVRCAVLVLAMRKKNSDMLASVESPPGASNIEMNNDVSDLIRVGAALFRMLD